MHISSVVCTRCVWLEFFSIFCLLRCCVGPEQDLERLPWLSPSCRTSTRPGLRRSFLAHHTHTLEDHDEEPTAALTTRIALPTHFVPPATNSTFAVTDVSGLEACGIAGVPLMNV